MPVTARWIEFYLNTSRHAGFIRSHKEWLSVVEKYGGDVRSLLALKRHYKQSYEGRPDFGDVSATEYCGVLTLGQWAKKNGMDLDV